MVKTRVKEATLNPVEQLCPEVRLLSQGFLLFTHGLVALSISDSTRHLTLVSVVTTESLV